MTDAAMQSTVAQCPFSITQFEDIAPWEAYDDIRDKTPILWDDALQAWVILDFASCLEVEINEARFRNPYQDVPQVVVDIKGGGRNITLLSGKEHLQMRRFFMQLLTPDKIAAYTRNQIRPVIELLLERILARGDGKADLTVEFGDQIPPRVIAALLGMPWQDDALIAKILHLHEELMDVIGGAFRTEELRQKGLAVSAEINNLLLPYVRDRRDNPQDDFISRVWTDAPTGLGEEMNEADAIAICRELFLGGADTTVHGIANLAYMLLTDHETRTAVEADREKLPAAIEESMRLYGSVMYRFRISNDDTELNGIKIAKDQRLILLHSAANRDPGKYGCPNSVDLTRKPVNDHLAFNKGPRNCIGVNLARAEMREALVAVLDRMPNLRLDSEAEPPRFRGLFMRSWRPLHVRFDI